MTPRVLVAIVLLAGCGAGAHGSSESTGSARLECGPVVASLFARSEAFVAQIWGGEPELSRELTTVTSMLDRLVPAVVSACRDDRWSGELLRCMDRIAVTDDPHKCNHLFTTDQAVGLARRLVPVMREATARRAAP